MNCSCVQILFILIFLHVDGIEGQQNNTTSPTNSTIKPANVSITVCGEKTMDTINVPYFDSNETHINTNKTRMELNIIERTVNCPEGFKTVGFAEEDIVGFTYNSSLIYLHEQRLIPPDQYCVKASKSGNKFRICYKIDANLTMTAQAEIVNIYIPCLCISTICYFGSAIIYYFILKVQDEHKKCFVGYSVSMGVTFVFLILLQTVNTGCDILGSLFFMFIFSSFVWLTCLCADLNFMILNFRGDNKVNRFYLYISLAILYPCVMILISLLITPRGSPDVPNSFMKNYVNKNMCHFNGNNLPMFFVPTGLLASLSILSLAYSFYMIRQNEKTYRNNFNWLEKRSEFKYMFRSCSLLMTTTAIWIVDVSLRSTTNFGNPYIFDSLEATQGIFAVAIFVFNRYTRKEIRQALCKTEKIKPPPIRLEDLINRFKDDTISDEEDKSPVILNI
ncbi:unnamed protein product [Phaedon cochleariae]|uniref:G-protein coupled receptors family 2 profile 2 domain-containing protein n=1 Tax=Phaedon cochleariae TaxID=80249 RepID=A0A9N9SNB0_PHACE|nr:unnamed protein product [Phaedon cochleariae]